MAGADDAREGHDRAAPVARRALMAGVGGASLTAGLTGAVVGANPAGAAPVWSNLPLALAAVDTPSPPTQIPGVSTTAQWYEDTATGFVYIRFSSTFTADYGGPDNGIWGFDSLDGVYGLPTPFTGTGNVFNLLGGAVTAHQGPLSAAVDPGGHQVLVAGFRAPNNQVLFAHGSTASGVSMSYVNFSSPYSWKEQAALKGLVFYQRA